MPVAESIHPGLFEGRRPDRQECLSHRPGPFRGHLDRGLADRPQPPQGRKIHQLDGRFWAATQGALSIFHDGRFRKPGRSHSPEARRRASHSSRPRRDAQDGLAVDDVRVIVERSPGGIRIGGYGGLTRLRDGQFTRWTEHDGLPSNSVRSIYEDSEASSGSEATTAAWAASKTASLPAIACAKGCSITASFRFSKMRMATFG